MCRVFTFHYLCGHVHSNHTLPCPSPTPFTSSPPACHSSSKPNPDSKNLSPNPSCATTTRESHLYPTLCDTCKHIGVISDWFASKPSKRFEAIMEWRRLDRREARRNRTWSSAPDEGATIKDTRNGGSNNAAEVLEEMPFIGLSDLQSSSSEEGSRSDSSASTATTVIYALSQQPSATSPLSPTIKITAASPPPSNISPPISTESTLEALQADHQDVTEVSSNTSAAKLEPSISASVISTAAETTAAAAAADGVKSPTTTGTTNTNVTATDVKVSTIIHRTQALVARMAALNKTMQNRSRLPVPASASTPTTHPKAKAKAKAKPTTKKSPQPRLPLPRPVGVGVPKTKSEAIAGTVAEMETKADR